jgi:hypothetical protein
MLDRAEFWLELLPPACQGIEVERIRAQVRQLRLEVETLGPSKIGQVNPNLFVTIPIPDGVDPRAGRGVSAGDAVGRRTQDDPGGRGA